MAWYARRGSKAIPDQNEYLGHLAMATRLQNVGVLLGAGASKSAGGKTIAEVWDSFLHEYPDSAEYLLRNNFVSSDESSGEKTANVEALIDLLEISEIDMGRRGELQGINDLKAVKSNLQREVAKAAILDEEIWSNKREISDSQKLADHVKLLARLVSNRQPGQSAPWVFTSNYDLAIEWAAEKLQIQTINGFSGLHHRKFSPSQFDLGLQNVSTRGEARFGTYNVYMGKLHGSLSWTIRHQDVVEYPMSTQWEKLRAFKDGETNEWPGLLIFPSSAKYVQTTGYVYSEIFRRFGEFLSRPNTCLLVCGYGFGDEHINRLLLSALQNPTFQLIIYLPQLDRYQLFEDVEQSDTKEEPPRIIKDLVTAQLPQVTFVGSGDFAYFNALVNDIPEPALIDEASEISRKLEKLLRNE